MNSHQEYPVDSSKNGLNPAYFGLRTLVADDNEVNRYIMSVMLEKFGLTCQIAHDGKEVLDVMGRFQFDLIFMDCHMPVMDGFEATKNIRANYKGVQPIIVAVTAGANVDDRDHYVASGMDDFLAKPVRKDTLSNLLNRIIKTEKGFVLNQP